MASRPHVALIGMMGSGKSTAGFWLAQSEGLRFVDLDAAIEERHGRSVSEIFKADGEERFRDMEQSELDGCMTSAQPLIVSCGGGVVLRAGNRALLRQRAWVCWLRASIETLTRRIRTGNSRPLLGENPVADLIQISDARAALYAETAHRVIDVDSLEASQVAERIKHIWPHQPSLR
ncbi:shikimate kinase [Candidatus Poriferisocius sp.]|uniref:shikimate kinase n=1 Tax=Candidatus Poriferisocius sp. TaxID=3101276 RepID=UPI003B02B65B